MLQLAAAVVDATTGGSGGDTPLTPIDIHAMNNLMYNNEFYLNYLSNTSPLSANNLNSTSLTILGYINKLTSRTKV